MKKRKRKLPKLDDFKPEIDLSNPMFLIGLRFPSVQMFRKAVRNYSVLNRRATDSQRMIKTSSGQFV